MPVTSPAVATAVPAAASSGAAATKKIAPAITPTTSSVIPIVSTASLCRNRNSCVGSQTCVYVACSIICAPAICACALSISACPSIVRIRSNHASSCPNRSPGAAWLVGGRDTCCASTFSHTSRLPGPGPGMRSAAICAPSEKLTPQSNPIVSSANRHSRFCASAKLSYGYQKRDKALPLLWLNTVDPPRRSWEDQHRLLRKSGLTDWGGYLRLRIFRSGTERQRCRVAGSLDDTPLAPVCSLASGHADQTPARDRPSSVSGGARTGCLP